MAKVIKRIDTAAVHRISSGQLVLDLAAAVKELVENSIDAGATNIEIKFKENGFEGLEVADNGTGIEPVNYENLALKHYTSKLRDFKDLESVKTLGFRGEALSSLCATCDLVVTTATQEQAPKGVQLNYNTEGHLVSTTPTARAVGTTMQLSNFFHSLPVRQREFKRNIKREYGKAIAVIQAYGIICEGIRIKAINQPSKGQSTRIISTNGNKAIKDNIANIFGPKLLTQIIPLSLDLSEVVKPDTEDGRAYLSGYVSKPEQGLGRSSSDRQYFYINSRPCNIPKLAKRLNELYRSFIVNQYPFLVINLEIPTDSYDVNVTPDKRTIFIHNEERLFDFIIDKLTEQLEPSRSTYTQRTFEDYISNNSPQSSSAESSSEHSPSSGRLDQIQESVSSVISSSTITTTRASPVTRSNALGRLKSLVNSNGQQFRPHTSTSLNPRPSKRTERPSASLENFISKRLRIPTSEPPARVEAQVNDAVERMDISEDIRQQIDNEDKSDVDMLEDSDEEQEEGEEEANYQEPDGDNDVDTVVGTQEAVSTQEEEDFSFWVKSTQTQDLTQQVHVNWDHICSLFSMASIDEKGRGASQKDETRKHDLENAGISNTRDNDRAIDALNRIIQKKDFERMQILGQFNLGFIVVSLDDQDLFLVDQHASDEKYNFETLQLHTRIERQRLYTPQNPELTVAEELIAVENADILRANGFEIDIDLDQEPTRRIKVLSQPVSKSTSFDSKDFSEIIHLLAERPGQMVRCSRVRAMFASRACRKSVMIGDSLTDRQMTEIVRHMGEIDQPWNCPHGRPTMRHLCNLSRLRTAQAKSRKLTFLGSIFRSNTLPPSSALDYSTALS